jgi:hypothetical protein
MDTTFAICTLPARFKGGEVSAAQLVRESGYVENPTSLTRVDVVCFLSTRPELIETWLHWSRDKRASSGWYFSREGDGYIVGCLPDGPRTTFQSMADACAEFVLREADSIARDLRSNNRIERARER